MNIQELFAKREQAVAKREAAYATMNSSVDDQAKFDAAQREYNLAAASVNDLNEQISYARSQKPVSVDKGQAFREILQGARQDKQTREITFGTQISTQSGAVTLNIKDVMPTLVEGVGLPTNLNIVTGVTGDVLYPVNVDDAEMEEVGENISLTDVDINFANIKPVSARTGLSVLVSNKAIDNAAFDLMGYVQGKFTLAQKKYIAKKLYSQANWSNGGPFANATSAGTITIGTGAYAAILQAVASFTDKGYDDSKVCLVMDAVTEANLKACAKAADQSGYVIENGKCCGYDYVVTHYINTVEGGNSKTDSGNIDTTKLYPTTSRYLGIGYFDYEAVQQHGEVRMTVDATSKAVAITNSTAVVLNTEWSFTDISAYNKCDGVAAPAFAVYTLA